MGLGRGTGTWDWESGARGSGTRGLGDARGLGDVINKQHLNLLSIIFGGLEKGVICWRACRVTLHRRRSSKVRVHGNFGRRGNYETCEYCESP